MSKYGKALICLSGHIRSHAIEIRPEDLEDYCSICGSKTIDSCLNCNTPIKGGELYKISSYYSSRPSYSVKKSNYILPKYCHNCGKPYPWTEKALNDVKELIKKEKKLSPEDKEILEKSIEELINETPNQNLTILRFKKLVSKAGPEFAEIIKSTLQNILSEVIIKMLFGNKL